MADVFLSYRNTEERRRLVTRFATILRAHDISVWWDHGLEAGESYRDQIFAELQQARLVIPFWCEESVLSPWVLMEARQGREKLLPVRIQRVSPPDEFESIHSIHLEDWNGSILDPVLDDFVRDVCERLGKNSRLAPDSKKELSRLPAIKPLRPAGARRKAAPAGARGDSGKANQAWLYVALPTAVVASAGAAALWLLDPFAWRQPVDASAGLIPAAAAQGEIAGGSEGPGGSVAQPSFAPAPAAVPTGAAAQPPTAPAAEQPTPAALAWQAVSASDPSALRAFLGKHPSGPESDSARDLLKSLDAAAWSTAARQNSKAGYERYLAAFPAKAKPPGAKAQAAENALLKVLQPPVILEVTAAPAQPTASPAQPATSLDLTPDSPANFPTIAELREKHGAAAVTRPSPGRRFLPPTYPPASERAKEEGDSLLELCVDPQGRVLSGKLVGSSGSERLDAAALKGIQGNRLNAGAVNGEPTAMCGYRLTWVWKLPDDPPPAPSPADSQ